jgi:hypothetical protein
VGQLSDYCPSLKNNGDAAIYILDSGRKGANLLITAGAHGNEIAGIMAALLLVEHAVAEGGRIFIVPYLNMTGIFSGNAEPVILQTPSGPRGFPYGTRLVPPERQGREDAEWYVSPLGEGKYPGYEQRNINRAYPGTEDAGLAQKIALAIMRLLQDEKIDIAIDLHEAGTTSAIGWHIISNPKNVHIAALAVLDLEEKNISMHIDSSPVNMQGLSHKEWGDRSNAMAFLIETVNPGQGDSAPPHLIDQVFDERYPLWKRVAVHLETIQALVHNANETFPLPVVYGGTPDYQDLEREGLEQWF